jgi:hypothetical protein
VHSVALILHSWVRWTVLVGFVVVIARTARRRDVWSRGDERAHVALVGMADLQLLLGLFLYFVASPVTRAFWADPRRAMPDSTLRFFGMEHVTMMLVGIAVLHVGRRRSKRAPNDEARRRTVFRFTLAAFLVVLSSVPWPFLRAGRPLFRLPPRADAEARPVPAGACPPVFASRCAPCHGKFGRGDGLASASLNPLPRDFTDAAWSARTSDERLRTVVRNGGAKAGLSVAMPPNADLSDAELDALVACIRSFSAAKAP